MAEYIYQAYNKKGKQIRGSIEAVSETEAVNILSKEGLFPSKVEQRGKAENTDNNQVNYSISQKKGDMQIFFTRQLANLLLAGIQLADALNILTKMMSNNNYKDIVEDIHNKLKSGKSFAESLATSSGKFSDDYINMIQAGEESGALGITCKKLAATLEERKKLKSFVITSLIYPCVLLIVCILAVIVMLVFVLPRFLDIYQSYDMTLPWITQIVLNISSFLQNNLLQIILFFIAIIVFARLYYNTSSGRNNLSKFLLKVPIVGIVLKESEISNFAANLSLMLDSGVPLLKSLSIVSETAANIVYQDGVKRVARDVKNGKKLSESLTSSGVFPEILNYMIMIGEETGQLSSMLEQVSKQYKEEYQNNINRLLNIFEPIVILLMGLGVGGIVIAMLLPILSLSNISF
ncbi:type II secretion system F family protein [Natronospora cellulosivora (SeqCode)]